jgi:hypothetical protein
MSKDEHASIEVELDGIVGDTHRSYVRKTWAGDKQPEGTLRRNERQWSAVSVEELAAIQEAMDLAEAPTPAMRSRWVCTRHRPGCCGHLIDGYLDDEFIVSTL